MGENFHLEVEAPYNNAYHAENIWLVMFLRTFGRRRPPTVAPRSINLFHCNKFKLRRERRPLAEGPKKHLPFARIANHSKPWDPPSYGALSIYIYFSCDLAVCVVFVILAFSFVSLIDF
jgi:hypothetical protein